VSETCINTVFLAKGNDLGYAGAISEALVFAVLNVVISFAIGLGGIRQLNCRGPFRKLLGALSLVAWLAFAALINLALAHYREVSGAFYEDAGLKVIAPPVGIARRSRRHQVVAVLRRRHGLVCHRADRRDFFHRPVPRICRARKASPESARRLHSSQEIAIAELQDIRDDATLKMEEAQSDLGKRRVEHSAILEGRARILQLFSEHQDQLERAGNALLSKYRTANRQARSSPAPSRFDEHWPMSRRPVEAPLPEMLLRKSLDLEIKNSEEVLGREIIAIHATFAETVETYRQIDDLIPDEPYGAAVQKKLA
jgi:hypothetical protein